MKKIKYDKLFIKHYRVRIKGNSHLEKITEEIVDLFLLDPFEFSLNNHELKDKMKGTRSFTVLPDLRIIYRETEKYYIFLDIGSHQEVYK